MILLIIGLFTAAEMLKEVAGAILVALEPGQGNRRNDHTKLMHGVEFRAELGKTSASFTTILLSWNRHVRISTRKADFFFCVRQEVDDVLQEAQP